MCIFPSHIWLLRGPTYEKIPVPCKSCWRCLSNRVNDYVGRCLAEASYSDWCVTLTLTYAPRADLADKILTPPHFAQFIRALRKKGHSLRYLVAGEYGELRGRAHFHCILFGKGKPLTIPLPDGGRAPIPYKENFHLPEWPHGHVFADTDSDEKALRYVCKYLLDKNSKRHWFSCSKKPALGAAFFQDKAALHVRHGVFPSSFEYMPPAGHKNRPYLITGVSRREFLRALLLGFAKAYPLDRKTLSEWVLRGVEKVDLWEMRQICKVTGSEEWFTDFAEELLLRAPPRKFVDTVYEFEDDYWQAQLEEMRNGWQVSDS